MKTVTRNELAEPIAPGLFEVLADGPHLIGGKRKSDGKIVFPCPRGAASDPYEAVPLSSTGTLWSFTVQRFRPKTPSYMGADNEETFCPFALGYVELPGQAIVESRIEVDSFQRLEIGMPMHLVLVPFPRLDGRTVTSFAFSPT